MAKPELGNKHQCQQCGTKFFDLNKSPIICPKCGAAFHLALARSSRAGAAEDEERDTETEAELVSLDEADVADEDKVVAGTDEEVEIEDDTGEDAFLEEEEEDSDDVAGLIDGDLAADEEP
ncbi:MAG: TIGR02300 family protein [Beijerinckiaceae bacterium]